MGHPLGLHFLLHLWAQAEELFLFVGPPGRWRDGGGRGGGVDQSNYKQGTAIIV